MHDEVKHEKKIESTLKNKDFEGVADTLHEMSSQLMLIGGKLTEGDENINGFEELQRKYDSRASWLAFLVVVVISMAAGIEIWMFKKNVMGNNKMR